MELSGTVNYEVHIHEEDGSYWAEVEELPGCFASGDTPDELRLNLQEAMGLYLSAPGSSIEMKLRDAAITECVETQSYAQVLVSS